MTAQKWTKDLYKLFLAFDSGKKLMSNKEYKEAEA